LTVDSRRTPETPFTYYRGWSCDSAKDRRRCGSCLPPRGGCERTVRTEEELHEQEVEQPIRRGYDPTIIGNTKTCQGKRWGIGNALSDAAHSGRAN